MTKPEELSRQLRRGSSRFLGNRRGVVGLSLAAISPPGMVSLYQVGIIRRVPEPLLPFLDANGVDAAPEAYEVLDMLDAVLGIASYALAAKVAFDVAQAGKLTLEQWTEHRTFCLWCLAAATASFATAPLVLPEARAALRELLSERG